MICCVIFDFDGTLVQSNDIKHEAFFDVTKHLPGARIILEKLLADPLFGDRFSIFSHLFKHLDLNSRRLCDPMGLVKQYTLLCEERIIQTSEINGATDTLTFFANAGFKLAISSATPEDALKKVVLLRGMNDLFSAVLGSPSSKKSHIEFISKNWKLRPSEILYVGDSEIDRISALNGGCHFVGVGSDDSRFNIKPVHLIDDLRDLLWLVKDLES